MLSGKLTASETTAPLKSTPTGCSWRHARRRAAAAISEAVELAAWADGSNRSRRARGAAARTGRCLSRARASRRSAGRSPRRDTRRRTTPRGSGGPSRVRSTRGRARGSSRRRRLFERAAAAAAAAGDSEAARRGEGDAGAVPPAGLTARDAISSFLTRVRRSLNEQNSSRSRGVESSRRVATYSLRMTVSSRLLAASPPPPSSSPSIPHASSSSSSGLPWSHSAKLSKSSPSYAESDFMPW